jgi:hypothetical protein
MKTYTIQPIPHPAGAPFPSEKYWAKASVAHIDQHHWTDHEFHPKCEVRGLYSPENLFLHFHSEEKEFATTRTEEGGEVWKDNCVEFFVSPSEDLSLPYLNFEFNMIGVLLLGVGGNREQRRKLSAAEMKPILRKADYSEPIRKISQSPMTWRLQAVIPLGFLHEQTGCPLPKPGTVWRANFNNCAADVPHPYYGNWNPIGTENPDFHRPEFFGKIVFG